VNGRAVVNWRILLMGFFAGALAATPAAALDPTRSLSQMFHRVYTRDDGLPGTVNVIVQAQDGYLLIGTDSGLYRFDGVRFERIAADRLSSPNISNLLPTKSGDLWVGYVTGGLSRLRNGVVTNYAAKAHGPLQKIYRLMEAPKGGGLWAMAGYTLLRFDGQAWHEVSGPWASFTGEGDAGVWGTSHGRDGTVWVKSGEGIFYCRPGCTHLLKAPGYAGGVMSFAYDRDGRIWTSDARAPGHMYTLPDIEGISDKTIPGPAYGGWVSERIRGAITIDREGTLWSAHGQNGLLRTRSVMPDRPDPNQVEEFGTPEGLSSNSIYFFCEDREGDMWVATDEGLDRFRPANVVLERLLPVSTTDYGYNAGPAGNALFFFASTINDANHPFNGSHGPLYRVSTDGSVQQVLSEMEQPYALRPAADGNLWAGTALGLLKLANGVLTPEPMPDGAKGVVLDVAENAQELFVSTVNHGVWRRANGQWSHLPGRSDQMGPWPIMTFDTKGVLWLLDHDAIGRYENGRVREIAHIADPDVGAFEAVTPGAHGMWFGGESGLAFYDGRDFHRLKSDRIPALTLVSGMVESEGQTWIASQAGIVRIDTATLERAMTHPDAPLPAFEVFDRRDGVSAGMQHDKPSSSSAFVGPDGRIWFLTDRGVVWIDPHDIHRNRLPPPVAIRSLAVGDHIYTSPVNLDLAAGTSSLEIDYAALSFVEPGRVQFRYKLDGVDRDWVNPDQRRQAFYTELGPGTYRFHVIASNDAGVWNQTGATLGFTIAPTFLQSVWFKILVALALAGLAWLAYAVRVRQVTDQLQTRFDVRIAERERIARELHDTLLQGCQGLLLRFQSIANRVPGDTELHHSIEDALNRADAVLAEGRARVRELRSGAAVDDLAQSLADAASDIIGGDTPRFHLTIEGEQRALNPLVGEEVLRIFEEAVRNVVKHARAKRIEALLAYDRGALRLSVRDDGAGMDAAATSRGGGHFGLIGMRERAERIGGQFEVTSREGAGTEVALSAPAHAAYKARRLLSFGSRAAVKGGAA
jgi:signal transduction histidine kinase/ligand-binding sensor domain-containing protein